MVDVKICIGSSCHLKGSYNVINTFQQMVEELSLHDKVEMNAQFCMRNCQQGVSVCVDEEVFSVSPETAKEFFRNTVVGKVK